MCGWGTCNSGLMVVVSVKKKSFAPKTDAKALIAFLKGLAQTWGEQPASCHRDGQHVIGEDVASHLVTVFASCLLCILSHLHTPVWWSYKHLLLSVLTDLLCAFLCVAEMQNHHLTVSLLVSLSLLSTPLSLLLPPPCLFFVQFMLLMLDLLSRWQFFCFRF